MKKNNRKKILSVQEIVIIVIVMLMITPLFLVLLNSLKTEGELILSPLSLPQKVRWENYRQAFSNMGYIRSFTNTFKMTFYATAIGVFLYSMAAYGLVRAKSGKRFFSAMTFLFFLTLAVPPQLSLVPLSSFLSRIHLHESHLGVSLVFIGVNAGFGVFLLFSFISTVPIALEEAAEIDGCTPLQIFWHIVLPLMRAPVTTLAVLLSLRVWNNFLYPLILLSGKESRTLPLSVFFFKGADYENWPLLFAALVLAIFPLLIFYFFMQRRIISGISDGAVKG